MMNNCITETDKTHDAAGKLISWRNNTRNSQAQLAVLAGVSQATISRIEAGLHVPDPRLAIRLAKITRIPAYLWRASRAPVDWLLKMIFVVELAVVIGGERERSDGAMRLMALQRDDANRQAKECRLKARAWLIVCERLKLEPKVVTQMLREAEEFEAQT
jgi:transcriptional regulator with XRE-family HTH domain